MITVVSKTRGPVFYATNMSPCFDLRAEGSGVIEPGEIVSIPTGLAIGKAGWLQRLLSRWFVFELQIRPRKVLVIGHGVALVASPITLSCKENQEICVLLQNGSELPFCYSRGERLAEASVGMSFRAKGVAVGRGAL